MTATLRLYNTLTRSKEAFAPIDENNVRMYVCGPTVYDYAHIGNARPVIVFDLLFRLLRHLYGPEHVTYVRNITDVDDKINARAARDHPDLPLNEAIRKVTTATEAQFHRDIRALGVLMPEDVNEPGKPLRFVEPRATEHIGEMRALIERLVAGGHAYVAADHVLFDVPSMPDYGALSRRPLDEMEAGARVDVAPYKRSPLDFVLWKPSKPGEPAWPSPAGIAAPGRPGWHIECSAMSWKHLGETFDIHAGGIDLVFPHHENEVAQSRCCFSTPVMANTWLHNGFLQVEGEKMSKSLGNFVTIHELLATEKFGGRSWPGEVLRLAMLKTHYRQPIDWTVRALEEAEEELQGWANALANTRAMYECIGERERGVRPGPARAVSEALMDDLNTPRALAGLRSLFANRGGQDSDERLALLKSCEFLGVLRSDRLFQHNRFHVGRGPVRASPELNSKLDEIQIAAGNGLTARVDDLRRRLALQGVKVQISPNGALSYEIDTGAASSSESQDIDRFLAARTVARAQKNWAESDRIRDELKAMGIVLKDNKDGTTTWEVAR